MRMIKPAHTPFAAWLQFKAYLRRSDLAMLALAALAGAMAGVVVWAITLVSQSMHMVFFGIRWRDLLSGVPKLASPWMALVPIGGAAALALALRFSRRSRPIDPIEANALYGGRMSLRDSVNVVGQNLISNGFGLSVGLEACYTQMASALASAIGRIVDLRRNDMRTLVGCGAAGAIGAAFSAPLTGAFYGFETIIGTYSIGSFAPVMTAAFTASTVRRLLAGRLVPFDASLTGHLLQPFYYGAAILLGIFCAGLGMTIMYAVTSLENVLKAHKISTRTSLLLGGIIVGGLSLISPQVLSAGHGALHRDMSLSLPALTVAGLLALKASGSVVSLGCGFRGGLFYASLLLGALAGSLFAQLWLMLFRADPLPIELFALIGMSALAAAIVGGPLTMVFLGLELSRDLPVTGLALLAVIAASFLTRKIFGFSFATWRFHARGENIRGAYDVGWINSLTVQRLMRPDVIKERADTTLAQFQQNHPLGANQRVVLIDGDGRYCGIVRVADAFDPSLPPEMKGKPVSALALYRNAVLTPQMNAKTAALLFEQYKSEAFAVVDSLEQLHVIGLLSERHALRRYAEELDKQRGELIGELG